MNKIIKNALINAIGTTLYIILVVSFIFSLQAFSHEPEDNIIIPIAMLLLFVFSAALTGFLVFGRPVMWYLDGKKKEAVSLIGYTLAILLIMVIVAFLTLALYFSLN